MLRQAGTAALRRRGRARAAEAAQLPRAAAAGFAGHAPEKGAGAGEEDPGQERSDAGWRGSGTPLMEHAHMHKARVAVRSAAEGFQDAGAQVKQVVQEVAAQVAGREVPEPEPTPTERYKCDLRLGGDASGAAHEAQDGAYASWHEPGARPIEQVFPEQVEAASLQNLGVSHPSRHEAAKEGAPQQGAKGGASRQQAEGGFVNIKVAQGQEEEGARRKQG